MDKRFSLSPVERCPITILDDVSLVRLPLGDRTPLKQVKKRARVAKGALIATHSSPNVGDMHAPFDGMIQDVSATYIEIGYDPLPDAPAAPPPAGGTENEADLAAPVPPVSLDGLDSVALAGALKKLGLAVRPFTRPCDVFILNGLNPEPGMLFAQEILAEYMPVLEAGFALLKRLNPAPSYVLALPEGSSAVLEGASVFPVKAQYPISLARPLIRKVTGKERTGRVSLVRVHNLFHLGLIARSGLPLTESVVTAFGRNYLAPLGTPVATFLERAGLSPEPGDSVVLGGAMRGVAISGTRRGLRKVDDAMQFVRKNSKPELGGNPCINCGACVSLCPMRLRPNMLSRYAEFELYESCRKEYIETCIECGMCGYICPACRPMQQHFRMAKRALGLSTFQHRLRQ
jgi:electron transport complex protein RnfC